MKRMALDDLPELDSDKADPAVTYQVWIPDDQIEIIRKTVVKTGMSWPTWVERAIDRLESIENDPDMHGEIENLMACWPKGRRGKKCLSFRLHPSTRSRCQSIALMHNGTVQAVLGHAFYMQSVADSINKTCAAKS